MKSTFFYLGMLCTALQADVKYVDNLNQVFAETEATTPILLSLEKTKIDSNLFLQNEHWRQYADALLKRAYPSEIADELLQMMIDSIEQEVSKAPSEIAPSNPSFFKPSSGNQGTLPRPLVLAKQTSHDQTFSLKEAGFQARDGNKSIYRSFAIPEHPSSNVIIEFQYLEVAITTKGTHQAVAVIDDQLDFLQSVDQVLSMEGIEATCFYCPSESAFNPVTAMIQFDKLFRSNQLLSNYEAALLQPTYLEADLEEIFFQTVRLLESKVTPKGTVDSL